MIYTDDNRGKILSRERRQQIIDFSGLRYGNSTPTDIDGFIEYKDKARVLIEIKYRDNPISNGQALAFTRLCNDEDNLNKPTVFIIAEHYVDDVAQDVDAAECIVRQIYFKGEWLKPKRKCTLKEVVDRLIARIN